MHRLLRGSEESGGRLPQRPAQHHAIPRLQTKAQNEVWSWGITKLATMRRGQHLSLRVVIDLYSRFVVAWTVSRTENSALAQQLIDEATIRYRIQPGRLTLHQDRGFLGMVNELGITASHSRPRVSNDNPFSEPHLKTHKYQPGYPRPFDHIAHANGWCADCLDWYNFSHHHSGLAGLTAEQVFIPSEILG
jgi:putative transposase